MNRRAGAESMRKGGVGLLPWLLFLLMSFQAAWGHDEVAYYNKLDSQAFLTCWMAGKDLTNLSQNRCEGDPTHDVARSVMLIQSCLINGGTLQAGHGGQLQCACAPTQTRSLVLRKSPYKLIIPNEETCPAGAPLTS